MAKKTDFKWHLPFKTRGGSKARLLGVVLGDEQRYVVAVSRSDGSEDLETYTHDGFFYANGEYDNLDLVNCETSVNTGDLDLTEDQKDIIRAALGL